ncbi:MAG: 2-amino-4-hydroxy-6-hydroxymethyldihydropteridine diphosphokinase [Pseudomonadales bacterium]|nr:2-amino-4-hydroxy-6-hydroxymethyldihydropteridine diphosphokinase [Pseudomonadales bacterium]
MSSWVRSFIGLGGNLDHPEQRIRDACDELSEIPLCRRSRVSSLYVSEPLRGDGSSKPNQPDYINAVVELHTQLSAEQLLDELQRIEQHHGRTRSHKRWQSRTLDLDILLFGEQTISSERLQIPHKEMLNRNFVVIPLHEIANDLTLPNGLALQSALNQAAFEPLQILENCGALKQHSLATQSGANSAIQQSRSA